MKKLAAFIFRFNENNRVGHFNRKLTIEPIEFKENFSTTVSCCLDHLNATLRSTFFFSLNTFYTHTYVTYKHIQRDEEEKKENEIKR